MEHNTSDTLETFGTRFRVGQYSACGVTRETYVGPQSRIELSWHDPENGVINDVASFGRHVVDACAVLQLALLGQASDSMKEWLLANARWEPPGSLAGALRRVIAYVWAEAEADYLRCEAEGRAGHVFESVRMLERFATKP